MLSKVVRMYAHGGGEASGELSDLWPPEAHQQMKFHYCLYEVSVDVEVDMHTGRFRYIGFNGVPLEKATEWSP